VEEAMKHSLFVLALALAVPSAAQAQALHKDSEIKISVTTLLVVAEKIANGSITFEEGDTCSSYSDNALVVVKEIRPTGYILALYRNPLSFVSGNECPNGAKVLLTTPTAVALYRQYAAESNGEFEARNGKDMMRTN
jgi:hypothetical protein